MNVKCPNCRFKFDVNPTDVNEQNEVNCTCPRCGKTFVSQVLESNAKPPVEQPANQGPVAEPIGPQPQVQAQPEESEVELYYAAMKCIENGQNEEAKAYVTRLLQLNPTEQLYIKFKDKLDQADELKRKEEERIKTIYFSAMKCIDSCQFDQAEIHIRNLLDINPGNTMYQNLQNRLIEARRMEELRQATLRQQEETRKREEEQRKQQELLEKARRTLKDMFAGNNFDMEVMRGLNITDAQVKGTSDVIDTMPQDVREILLKLSFDQLVDWLRKPTNEKLQWVANAKENLLTPEQKRKMEEEQLYEKAQDYINQGLFNTAQDYVNRLLEMYPDNPKYQALSQKLGNSGSNDSGESGRSGGSGCMVVILALIISVAASIIIL